MAGWDSPARRPAVFLDRDGTLIEDRGHLREPSEVVFLDGAFDALRRLQQHFLLFVVTNQPGVAEGALTLEDVERVNGHVVGVLEREGVAIAGVYVCPHARGDRCRCIKPNPDFLHVASEQYAVDLGRSYTVGDHPHDVRLGWNAGASGLYVLTGHGRKHRADVPAGAAVFADIGAAASYILGAREAAP